MSGKVRRARIAVPAELLFDIELPEGTPLELNAEDAGGNLYNDDELAVIERAKLLLDGVLDDEDGFTLGDLISNVNCEDGTLEEVTMSYARVYWLKPKGPRDTDGEGVRIVDTYEVETDTGLVAAGPDVQDDDEPAPFGAACDHGVADGDFCAACDTQPGAVVVPLAQAVDMIDAECERKRNEPRNASPVVRFADLDAGAVFEFDHAGNRYHERDAHGPWVKTTPSLAKQQGDDDLDSFIVPPDAPVRLGDDCGGPLDDVDGKP